MFYCSCGFPRTAEKGNRPIVWEMVMMFGGPLVPPPATLRALPLVPTSIRQVFSGRCFHSQGAEVDSRELIVRSTGANMYAYEHLDKSCDIHFVSGTNIQTNKNSTTAWLMWLENAMLAPPITPPQKNPPVWVVATDMGPFCRFCFFLGTNIVFFCSC